MHPGRTMANSAKPSKTADLVTAARAIHFIRAKPPIFSDDLAYTMCSRVWKTITSSRLLTWIVVDNLLKDVEPLTMAIYTRARFCEDEAMRAVEEGMEQIVILGAGYDTFALRHHNLGNKVTIFELDQPATQQEKRSRMKSSNIAEPANVRYISSDLNQEDLFEVLVKNGFDTNKPALFSWFGVTYYLPMETVKSTLSTISDNSAPNTEVLFDYLFQRSCVDSQWHKLYDDCEKFVAKKGEKWISSFDPDSMQDFLGECGYSNIRHLTSDKINSQYFAGRTDGLVYPAMIGLCKAVCD